MYPENYEEANKKALIKSNKNNPGSGDKRIILTQILDAWRTCTEFVFDEDSPYANYNFIDIYSPNSDSTRMPVYVKRGVFGFFIDDQLHVPADIDEEFANVIVLAFGSYNLHFKNIVEYIDRKSTRLNSSHNSESRMPSSA
jgi:hypothetical protein